MQDNDQNLSSQLGPFGMGWQGYLVIAIVILGTALFAATRRDWTSMLISALILPLIVFAVVHVSSRLWRSGTDAGERKRTGRGEGADLLTFLARTNPFIFLLFGAVSRGVDDERYQELLRSGPYGLGQYGYLIALIIILAPLIFALIIMAIIGQLPTHSGLHFP